MYQACKNTRWDNLPNLFVDNDPNSSFRHIEDTPSFPMVVLVRHSFLESTISLIKEHPTLTSLSRPLKTHLYINNITDFIYLHVSGQVFHSW